MPESVVLIVGQKVHLNYSVKCYGKIWMNFLADPISLDREELRTSPRFKLKGVCIKVGKTPKDKNPICILRKNNCKDIFQ